MKIPARILIAVVFIVLASLLYLTAGSARTRSMNPQTAPTNLNASFSTDNQGKEISRPLPPIIETPIPPSASNHGTTGYPPPLPTGYPPPAIRLPLIVGN